MCLAIYGAKCGIPVEEVKAKAFELIPFLDSINPDEPFTKNDCLSALECYDTRYCTFPIDDIIKISGIDIEKNKRNGRKKDLHIKMVNEMRKFKRDVLQEDEYKNSGRPAKGEQVINYLMEHPNDNISSVANTLGVSRTTIYKYKKMMESEV